jgi:hypothetical protein
MLLKARDMLKNARLWCKTLRLCPTASVLRESILVDIMHRNKSLKHTTTTVTAAISSTRFFVKLH